MEEGSGNGASLSLSVGALRGKPGGRAPLLGTLKNLSRKALGTGISLHRGPVAEPGVGFERRMEGSGSGAFLSMGAL
jgi:hypothetical protein